jgi:thymidylate synthase
MVAEHYFRADNVAQLARKNLKNILLNGIHEKRQVGDWCMKKPQLEEMIETYSVTFELTNPKNCITSQHCLGAEVETEDYILGLNPGFVHMSPWSFYSRWLNQNGKYHYTYGIRGGKYIPYIIQKLKNDSTTRQCVINLWDTKKDFNEHFVPCTTQWLFSISKGKLNMTSTMRSQDACRGFFLDMFAYPMIQQIVSKALGIPMGSYTHVVLNSHIYADDISFAKEILERVVEKDLLEIDELAGNEEFLKLSSVILYEDNDTKNAQVVAECMSPFWCNWKKNQIIYIYTKYLSKIENYPIELTCVGEIHETVLPKKKAVHHEI